MDAKDALKEAEVCHSVLKSYKNKLTLPVFFDFEYDSETYNGEITYTCQGRTDIIRAFCEAMKGYGYQVGYYTNRDYIQNRIDKARFPTISGWRIILGARIMPALSSRLPARER